MSEVVKFSGALLLVCNEESWDFVRVKNCLHKHIIQNFMDTLKVCVPSAVYMIQNNILYVAASNLDVGTYQVKLEVKKPYQKIIFPSSSF